MCEYDGMTERQIVSLQGDAALIDELNHRMTTIVEGEPLLRVEHVLKLPEELQREVQTYYATEAFRK